MTDVKQPIHLVVVVELIQIMGAVIYYFRQVFAGLATAGSTDNKAFQTCFPAAVSISASLLATAVNHVQQF